jgi:hypothetical protein
MITIMMRRGLTAGANAANVGVVAARRHKEHDARRAARQGAEHGCDDRDVGQV